VTSETYARRGPARISPDSVIVLVMSGLAAVLVIAGLLYAAGTSTRHKAALAAAACEPNLSPSGLQCTTAPALASQYEAITTASVQQLTTDMSAYTISRRHHLAAAEAALTAQVTLEKALGASLARFPFPAAAAPVARTLIEADRACATLTARAARSSSLTQLRTFDHRVLTAVATVRADMTVVRQALGSRPTANQEP
jgi:hypothetical protein